jgi:hypothetical protein
VALLVRNIICQVFVKRLGHDMFSYLKLVFSNLQFFILMHMWVKSGEDISSNPLWLLIPVFNCVKHIHH